MGHKRTSLGAITMSALPPTADMCDALANVRFGPEADIRLVIRLSHRRDTPVITAPVYARDNHRSIYARPALRKVFAAFPADTKVA
jgi:hypothetical protein